MAFNISSSSANILHIPCTKHKHWLFLLSHYCYTVTLTVGVLFIIVGLILTPNYIFSYYIVPRLAPFVPG